MATMPEVEVTIGGLPAAARLIEAVSHLTELRAAWSLLAEGSHCSADEEVHAVEWKAIDRMDALFVDVERWEQGLGKP